MPNSTCKCTHGIDMHGLLGACWAQVKPGVPCDCMQFAPLTVGDFIERISLQDAQMIVREMEKRYPAAA